MHLIFRVLECSDSTSITILKNDLMLDKYKSNVLKSENLIQVPSIF